MSESRGVEILKKLVGDTTATLYGDKDIDDNWGLDEAQADLTKALLDALPKESIDLNVDGAIRNGFNDCLSEVITSIKKTMGC